MIVMYLLDMKAKYAEKNKWGKTPLNLCEESLEKVEPKVKKANQKPPPKGSLHDRLIQTRKTLMAAMGAPEEEQAKSDPKAKSPTKKPDPSMLGRKETFGATNG